MSDNHELASLRDKLREELRSVEAKIRAARDACPLQSAGRPPHIPRHDKLAAMELVLEELEQLDFTSKEFHIRLKLLLGPSVTAADANSLISLAKQKGFVRPVSDRAGRRPAVYRIAERPVQQKAAQTSASPEPQ